MSAVQIAQVQSQVSGRIRLAIPGLRHNPRLAQELEALLAASPGILEVRAAPVTGTLLVHFDPALPPAPWQTVLAYVIGGRRTSPIARRTPRGVAKGLASLIIALRGTARFDLRGAASDARPEARAFPKPRGAALIVSADRGRPNAWSRAKSDRGNGPSKRASEDASPEATGLPDQPDWHVLSIEQACRELAVPGTAGLDAQDVAKRLEIEGANVLAPAQRRSQLRILFDQLASTPVAMLGASAVISVVTGGLGEAVAIGAVLGINATIGYITESGAERTISSLTRAPMATVPVLRNGAICAVCVSDVVRGDVLDLHAGVSVSADARLFAVQDLTVDESSLTGESMPVAKSDRLVEHPNTPLAERANMVFRGTVVTGGSGRALVVATAGATQIGHIQTLTNAIEQRSTPMQIQLDRLGRQLALGAGLACFGTMGIGLLRGQRLLPMFRTAMSLAVAAVPEGLPTVAITTLALGLSRLRGERVIVRQLAAVETLGSVQVLCIDKTGTITQNCMRVDRVEAGLEMFCVEDGHFRSPAGKGEVALPNPDLDWLLRLAVLCNEVELAEEAGQRVLRGSPTESALVRLALDAGLDVQAVRASNPVRNTQRRAQARSYMTTQHEGERGAFLAVKGRPSDVLALCSTYISDGQRRPLGESERARIETNNERMAGHALRVLGFASLDHEAHGEELEPELAWVGLVGMEDPPRDGVREVIAKFHAAGVRTIMITGDQSATAQAIGRKIGLGGTDGGQLEIIDSTRLDRIDAHVLESLAQRADVFARVSPAHKLQIVKALQTAGFVVAMTGDGVNDGPALKAADIGVAMGLTGSSAAREVADVVLEDDDLHELIMAIKQGRTIYDDIRKAVRFILGTNLSEILYTFAIVSSGLGEPLTPLQLLWINLLTDVLPELALAVQPSEASVLSRPPRDADQPMFARSDMNRIFTEGAVITSGALAAYLWARPLGSARAGTVGFTALTLAQLLHAVSTRSESHTVFDRESLARNRWLPLALGATAGLQLAAGLAPGLRTLLGSVPLRAGEWGVALGAAVVPFLVNETNKLITRPRQPSHLQLSSSA